MITIENPATAPSVYVLGDRLQFLGSVAGRDLHVLEITVPPGSGTPPHRHQSMEIFRISSGEITFGIFGDGPPQMVKGGPGAVVTVPGNHAHNYTNLGSETASMIVVVETQMKDFFEEVGTTVAPPPGPPSEAEIGRVLEACARHGIEILGQPGG
jgi:quercetin dioxygenase-like cupin family protein